MISSHWSRISSKRRIYTTIMSSDVDVAIAGSVPLIHDLDDVDPTLAPIKTSRRRSKIRMMFNLNTHALILGMRGARLGARSNHVQCSPFVRRLPFASVL